MTTYVALLRGINVGRAKRVAMADLRAVYAGLGLTDVRTHLQSGNVVFESPDPPEAAALEAALLERTGVPSSVLVLSGAELVAAAAENPLVEFATDPARLIVTFLPEPADPGRITLPDPGEIAPEVLSLGARALYQWTPQGVLGSGLKPAFWKQFGPRATARNWRTVTKLLELCSSETR